MLFVRFAWEHWRGRPPPMRARPPALPDCAAKLMLFCERNAVLNENIQYLIKAPVPPFLQGAFSNATSFFGLMLSVLV